MILMLPKVLIVKESCGVLINSYKENIFPGTLNLVIYVPGVIATIALSQQCNKVHVEAKTQLKTHDGSFMSYVGENNSTAIQCDFICDSCTRKSIYWNKDGDIVYAWYGNGSSGPLPGYEDKVTPNLIVEDNYNGIYMLEWKRTEWQDLPGPGSATKWDCYVQADICTGKQSAPISIEYYSE